jgi:hypothetical protein
VSTAPAAGLLDTSVFIADGTGRRLDDSLIPAEDRGGCRIAVFSGHQPGRRLRSLDGVAGGKPVSRALQTLVDERVGHPPFDGRA